jgi:hypothetical protein
VKFKRGVAWGSPPGGHLPPRLLHSGCCCQQQWPVGGGGGGQLQPSLYGISSLQVGFLSRHYYYHYTDEETEVVSMLWIQTWVFVSPRLCPFSAARPSQQLEGPSPGAPLCTRLIPHDLCQLCVFLGVNGASLLALSVTSVHLIIRATYLCLLALAHTLRENAGSRCLP